MRSKELLDGAFPLGSAAGPEGTPSSISCDTRERENGAPHAALSGRAGDRPVPIALVGRGAGAVAPLLRAALAGRPGRAVLPMVLSPEVSVPEGVRFPLLLCTDLPPGAWAALEALGARSDLAVLDADDPQLRQLAGGLGCPVFTYSERHQEADLTAENLRAFPDRLQFEAAVVGGVGRVVLPPAGGHALYHALAALAAAVNLGVPLDEAAQAVGRQAGACRSAGGAEGQSTEV